LDDVKKKYTGVRLPNKTSVEQNQTPNMNTTSELRKSKGVPPESKDWRKSGVVTPPKHQQECGSCTLFALTAALESSMAIYKKKLDLDLSEQELLDCPKGSGVFKCSGNWPEDIYEYQKTVGQTSEKLYRYEAKEGFCRSGGKAKAGKVSAYYRAKEGDENAMKEFVGNYGPSSLIITISDEIVNYKSGVMNTPCKNTTLDHSVLAVGYGNENGRDYWIIKNSWGTAWGEGGYFKMARNAGNICRVADYVLVPQV